MDISNLLSRASEGLKKRSAWALALILTVGTFFRFYRLTAESIWYDEGFSIRIAGENFTQMLRTIADFDFNPPLYLIILHFWTGIFGNSEFSARFPSVIFGVLSIFMLYKLGCLLYNKNIAIVASALLALSQLNIYYSQEARTFSLLVFLTLCSIYFFVKMLNSANISTALIYVVSSILLVYTHVFGLFVLVVQGLYYLFVRFSVPSGISLNLKRWTASQSLILAGSLPWIWFLVSKFVLARTYTTQASSWSLSKPTLASIVSTFGGFSGDPLLIVLYIGLGVVAFADYFEARDRRTANSKVFDGAIVSTAGASTNIEKDKENLGLLLIWLIIPVVSAFIISSISVPIYADKYLIGSSPAFYLLTARGLTSISHKYAKFFLSLALLAASLFTIYASWQQPQKAQWRDVAQVVEAKAKAGDMVFFNRAKQRTMCYDYYAKRKDLTEITFMDQLNLNEASIKNLAPAVAKYKRIWFVLYGSEYNGMRVENALAGTYNVAYHQPFNQIDLYLFVKKE